MALEFLTVDTLNSHKKKQKQHNFNEKEVAILIFFELHENLPTIR